MAEINHRSLRDVAGLFDILASAARPASPSISVLMPVYNGIPFLPTAIESILGQSCGDFEFLILNDGSTDGTRDTVMSYMEKDPRIVLVEQSNLGLTKSLNRATRLALSPMIARQDADDYSHPDRFREMLAFSKSTDAPIKATLSAEIAGTGAKASADVEIKPGLHPYEVTLVVNGAESVIGIEIMPARAS